MFSLLARENFYFFMETVFFLAVLLISHCHVMIQGAGHSRARALGAILQILERRRHHDGVDG